MMPEDLEEFCENIYDYDITQLLNLNENTMEHYTFSTQDNISDSSSSETDRLNIYFDSDDLWSGTENGFENSSMASCENNSSYCRFINDINNNGIDENVFLEIDKKNDTAAWLDLYKEISYDINTLDNTNNYKMITKKQLFDDYLPVKTENDDKPFTLNGTGYDSFSQKAKTILNLKEFKALFDAKANCIEEIKNKEDVSLDDVELKPQDKHTEYQTSYKCQIKKKINTEEKCGKNKIRKIREQPNRCYHLWDFLREILTRKIYPDSSCAKWVCEKEKEFIITNTKEMAILWGKCKKSNNMTYDKLSRAIRYYCTLDILKKITGKRLQFKFSNGRMWTKM